nr:GNAT family N-acetyltransferase [Shewanella gaetbuli]
MYEIVKLRVDVFVVEQNCPYPELDEKDRHSDALHLVVNDREGQLLGYCRVLPPGLSYPQASIGRIVVSEDNRGQGIAQKMVQDAIAKCIANWPEAGIQIGAQEHLQKFYHQLGFYNNSEVYLEDDIPHIDMIYQAK